MINPLNFCKNHVPQKLFSTGVGYLCNRKVYLLGGAAILICAFLKINRTQFPLFSSVTNILKRKNITPNDENIREKISPQIASGHGFSDEALLDETRILKFVTHPKARYIILEGREISHKYASDFYPEVQRFGESYSSYPEVQKFVREFEVYCNPVPYEAIVVPFLSLGIADTSDVTDPVLIKEIQAFQVRIFKYWLSLYRIGEQDKQLFKDLLAYCKTSSLDLFSKLIGPFLEKFLWKEDDNGEIDHYDEIIGFFIGNDDWPCYNEEEVFDSETVEIDPENRLPKEVKEALNKARDEILQRVYEQIEAQTRQHFDEQEMNKSPGEKLVENFKADLKKKGNKLFVEKINKEHFSKDAIIELFHEITKSKSSDLS